MTLHIIYGKMHCNITHQSVRALLDKTNPDGRTCVKEVKHVIWESNSENKKKEIGNPERCQ